MAGMHSSQNSDRYLLSADDATDGSAYEDQAHDVDDHDCGDLAQSLSVRNGGAGLQTKSTGLRKGKCDHAPERRSHIGGGKCRALNERTAHLLQGITKRLQLDAVHERMRIHRDHHSHVYCVSSRDKTASYEIKIFTNDKRQQLKACAQQEFALLSRVYAKRLPVPEPVLCQEHILVTRCIATANNEPVPRLKGLKTYSFFFDRHLCYMVVLDCLRKLYQDAGVVHGNVSDSTIRYGDAECWLTDFGHAMDREQPGHLELLAQDVARVNAIFLKRRLPTETKFSPGVLPDEVAMAYITMQDLTKGFGRYCLCECFHSYTPERYGLFFRQVTGLKA